MNLMYNAAKFKHSIIIKPVICVEQITSESIRIDS
jgi:hypothetical protein